MKLIGKGFVGQCKISSVSQAELGLDPFDGPADCPGRTGKENLKRMCPQTCIFL